MVSRRRGLGDTRPVSAIAAASCARRELDSWSRMPRSRLALNCRPRSILSHRLPRDCSSTSRKTPGARFGARRDRHRSLRGARDPLAENLLHAAPRAPEDLTSLDRAIPASLKNWWKRRPRSFAGGLSFPCTQARGYRDVIMRFGRHPHRNEALGRQSTLEELEYLASGRSVHTRDFPR